MKEPSHAEAMIVPFTFPGGALTQPSPAIVGPSGPNFVCVTGTVNLFQFIRPPSPGDVIGTLLTGAGAVSLIQTQPVPLAGVSLAQVDRQLATVCGNLVFVGGQAVLDVRFVSPGISPITPGISPLLLSLLLLLTAGAPRP